MNIFHNPRCSKSRQTLQLLTDKGVDVTVIEYLKTPPSIAELTAIIQTLSIPPIELIRKNEEAAKAVELNTLSDDALIELMCQHPRLIERPIVFNADKAAIGRPPENILEIL